MKVLALSALLLAAAGPAARAEVTHVRLRAQSADAKFIGTHTGGVGITLTDARTGKVLARGTTTGGTGDTARIMTTPRQRGAAIADGDTAAFDTVLDLNEPTLVRVDAVGPLGRPASVIHVSSEAWILPGRDIGGDGWVLTFPGLVIEPSATPEAGGGLAITARVTLMCGCPIQPGGLWDAANYTVEARLLRGRRQIGVTRLAYAGQPSQFAGALQGVAPGRYRLRLTATDARTPNAGVVEQPVRVLRPPATH